MITSVVATPLADTVTTVSQAPEATSAVFIAAVPLAIRWATVADPAAVGITRPESAGIVPPAPNLTAFPAVPEKAVPLILATVGFGYVPPRSPPAAPAAANAFAIIVCTKHIVGSTVVAVVMV